MVYFLSRENTAPHLYAAGDPDELIPVFESMTKDGRRKSR